MRTLFLSLLTALAAFSQTGVTSGQVRTAAAPAAYRLFAFDATGRATLVEVGAGLTIANGVISAKAPVVTATVSVTSTVLARAADGTYQAVAGAVVYTRNGLLILEGVDYTVVAGRITPNPVAPWAADDQVVVRRIDVTVQ